MECFSTLANDCSEDEAEGVLGDADCCAFSTGGWGLDMQEDSCDEDTTAAGPQFGGAAQEAGTTTPSKPKVQSYARRLCDGSTKGIRLPWAQHVQEHLFSIDTPFAWYHRAHKCDPSCPTPGRCPRRATPEAPAGPVRSRPDSHAHRAPPPAGAQFQALPAATTKTGLSRSSGTTTPGFRVLQQ